MLHGMNVKNALILYDCVFQSQQLLWQAFQLLILYVIHMVLLCSEEVPSYDKLY